MEEKKHGLAIVGFGGMGRRHTEMIQQVPQIVLCGIYDVLEQQKELARSLGINAYNTMEELLADPAVDLVLVATPNNYHKDIAVQALRAGKNVICEKPVTVTSAELEEIIATANECGRLFTVHQNRRWDDDYLTIKKVMDEGTIGDVFHLETRVHGSRGIPQDWRRAKSAGGGMLFDWGVHLLDRLLLLIPEKIRTVYCKLSHILGQEVDDGFWMLLIFESGKTAIVEASTWNFDTLPKWYVCGSKGTAVIQDWDLNGRIALLKDFENFDTAPVKGASGYTKTMAPRVDDSVAFLPLPKVESDVRDFYRNVLDTLDGKSSQLVQHEQVLRVMRLIEAAFLSDAESKVCSFEL